MTAMAVFPALAEPIAVPVSKLAVATIAGQVSNHDA
jgi:hypothetical protein